MKFTLAFAVTALLAVGTQAHTLKQAKARDVAARSAVHDKFSELAARAPDPSHGTCTCPDGSLCSTHCASDCNIKPRKRDANTEKRDMFWILPSDFSGEIYSGEIMAELIKGDGMFVHTNGTTVVDWEYKANSEANRLHFWKNKRAGSGMMERVRRSFIQFSAPYLAKTIAVYFSEPDKVFMMSESSGVQNKDIIRMAKALLEDKESKDFMIWHHVIDRPTIETVVSTLCPRLGPQYCEN